MTTRERLVKIAEWQIGVREKLSANNNPYALWADQWIDTNGHESINLKPWCGIFSSWVYDQAGERIVFPNDPGKGLFSWGFSYVPTAYNYFKANNLLTDNPLPGDLVIYDWEKQLPGETSAQMLSDHVGMFIGWIDRKAGTFYTIEGNIGDACSKKQRNMAFVLAFANPRKLS